MKTFFVLICSLALASAARAGKQQKATTTNTKASPHVPAKTSQHIHPQTSQHIPAQTSQHAVKQTAHPPGSAHVFYGGEQTQRGVSEGKNPPRSGEATREVPFGRDTQNTL